MLTRRPARRPARRSAAPSRRRNPEYRYGVRNRPPGFATVPRGYIRIEEGIVPREARTRHGVVVYDRPLTVEEIESYELHPYMPLSEVVDRIVSDMDYPEEWAEEVRDAGERMIRPIAGQVLERDLPIYTDVPLGEVYEHVAKELLRRFPAARSNPRRRSAAPSRRRNPSWSKPIAYREDILEVLDEVFPEGAVLEARGYVSDAENLRAGKAHVRKVVLDRFKEQGRQVDEMDLGRVLSSELDHYAGQDGRGSFVEVFRKQTAASRGDFAALVGRNNPRRRAASRRNPAKIGAKALATALIRAVDASLDSGDLARMDAVHHIMEKEGMRSLDGLYRQIRHDPVDFILVAAPGFSTALKRATGKSRDEWARLIG